MSVFTLMMIRMSVVLKRSRHGMIGRRTFEALRAKVFVVVVVVRAKCKALRREEVGFWAHRKLRQELLSERRHLPPEQRFSHKDR